MTLCVHPRSRWRIIGCGHYCNFAHTRQNQPPKEISGNVGILIFLYFFSNASGASNALFTTKAGWRQGVSGAGSAGPSKFARAEGYPRVDIDLSCFGSPVWFSRLSSSSRCAPHSCTRPKRNNSLRSCKWRGAFPSGSRRGSRARSAPR